MVHGELFILKGCRAFSGPLRADESAQSADAGHPIHPNMAREKPQSEAGRMVWGWGLEK